VLRSILHDGRCCARSLTTKGSVESVRVLRSSVIVLDPSRQVLKAFEGLVESVLKVLVELLLCECQDDTTDRFCKVTGNPTG
jgi:hypothetical protein